MFERPKRAPSISQTLPSTTPHNHFFNNLLFLFALRSNFHTIFTAFCFGSEQHFPSLPTPPAIRRLIPQLFCWVPHLFLAVVVVPHSVFMLLVRLVDDYFWLLNRRPHTPVCFKLNFVPGWFQVVAWWWEKCVHYGSVRLSAPGRGGRRARHNGSFRTAIILSPASGRYFRKAFSLEWWCAHRRSP